MSVLIDGTTGEVIGPIPRSARQAKRTFIGETVKRTALVRTRVIRKYRGFRETQPITNRNPPPNPSMDHLEAFMRHTEKAARRLNQKIKQENPILGAIADILLDEFKKKRPR